MKKPLLLGIILTVCVVIVAFVFAQFYPEGMISYWKFDEDPGPTAFDSADANNGTIYGATRTTGQVGGALSFDGMHDYVKVPDHASLDFGPGQDFSLEAWIKATQNQAEWQGTILAKLNAPGQPASKRSYGYSLMVRGLMDSVNEGKIGVWLGDGDGSDGPLQLYSVNTYDDDTWHHVVATIDRDSLAVLYIDGSEVNNADVSYLSSLDESNSEYLEIGREGVYDQYWFEGLIDEVAIYDRALTPEEIQQHYQDGLHGLGYDVECVPPPPDLVSWWPGDGNAEDFVDGNHGTLESGATYAAGRVDQAFSFDGLDDYVDVGDIGLNGDWTIDFWAKLDTVARTIQYPIGMGPRANITYGTGIFMAYSHYGYKWGVYDGSVFFLGSPTFTNIWYHIAVTKSGTTYTAYLDGNYENSSGALANIDINNLQIGRRIEPSGSVWYFNGLIDEVEIFDRALSSEEIQAIYNAGSAGKCKELVNESPIPVCKDIEIPADENCQASITAEDVDDGSYDPDEDEITLSVDNLGPFSLGEHYVNLTVTDEHGESDTCEVKVTVVDTIPPIPDVAELPEVRGECSAEITSTPTATDNCAGIITGTTSDPHEYTEQGTHTVTWTYDDGNGNTATQTQTVVVDDVTAPEISVSVSPNILRPPNHKMVLITPEIIVSDNCDSDPVPEAVLILIEMNEGDETDTYTPEYDLILGDGHTTNDIQVIDGKIYLRAERSGKGDGRIYTITYTATDDAGNSATATATVTVPHDQK